VLDKESTADPVWSVSCPRVCRSRRLRAGRTPKRVSTSKSRLYKRAMRGCEYSAHTDAGRSPPSTIYNPPCACPVSVRQAGLACRTFSHPHQSIAEVMAASASVRNVQRDRCNVQDRNRECAHARPHDMRHGATPLLTDAWRRRVPNRAMQFWLRQQLCEAINLANVQCGAVLEPNGKLQIDSEQCWRLGMTVSALVSSATRCSLESAQGRILSEVARRGVQSL